MLNKFNEEVKLVKKFNNNNISHYVAVEIAKISFKQKEAPKQDNRTAYSKLENILLEDYQDYNSYTGQTEWKKAARTNVDEEKIDEIKNILPQLEDKNWHLVKYARALVNNFNKITLDELMNIIWDNHNTYWKIAEILNNK